MGLLVCLQLSSERTADGASAQHAAAHRSGHVAGLADRGAAGDLDRRPSRQVERPTMHGKYVGSLVGTRTGSGAGILVSGGSHPRFAGRGDGVAGI